MFHILIVEDDLNKIERLKDFIRERYDGVEIATADSWQQGLKFALLESPDIIVLDMSMPTWSLGGHGGRERRYAGRDILRRLRRKNSPCRAVVITQFEQFGDADEVVTVEELAAGLRRDFDDRYLGLVRYRAADTSWQVDLQAMLDPIVGA